MGRASGLSGPGLPALGATLVAWLLYAVTLAPGLTWAHHGADGGDLLAAALVNGVPHPSGYPLYTVLLQGWLAVGRGLGVTSPAWLGNSLSAFVAGLSAGATVYATHALLEGQPRRRLWAGVAGGAWAIAPLVWSQALITEVYALHGLLIALLGWAVLVEPHNVRRMGVLLGLGLAHHLTTALLWPALVYALRSENDTAAVVARRAASMTGIALIVAALCYARISLVAGQGPPPVNWGYAVDWAGFWWLISGEAYRGYLFALTPAEFGGRVLGVGRTLVDQVTPLGLAAVIAGAATWERRRGVALLWVLPVGIYAAAYATVDSRVYLLPVVWLVMVWLAQGCAAADRLFMVWRAGDGSAARVPAGAWAATVCVLLAAMTLGRLPALSLRGDDEAERYVAAVVQVVPPHSLVISGADAPTFALWYAAWASGELDVTGREVVLLNADLMQFGWYRRLMHDLVPTVVAADASFSQVIAANRGQRPIFFTEATLWPAEELVPVGPLWRLVTGD